MALFTPNISVDNTPLEVDGSGVTQPISGTVDVSSVSGTVVVNEAGASTATTLTQIALSANISATLLSANPARLGAIIFIPSATTGNPVYVKFGATASSTSFTYKVVSANTTIEFPKSWLGQLDILSVNAQTVNITEF